MNSVIFKEEPEELKRLNINYSTLRYKQGKLRTLLDMTGSNKTNKGNLKHLDKHDSTPLQQCESGGMLHDNIIEDLKEFQDCNVVLIEKYLAV
jgi:hypothetical protein